MQNYPLHTACSICWTQGNQNGHSIVQALLPSAIILQLVLRIEVWANITQSMDRALIKPPP